MTSSKKYNRINYQIGHNSKILFVGTNPSLGSYLRKVPFSSNKSFWYLLHDAGLLFEDRNILQNDKTLKEMFLTKFNKIYRLIEFCFL
jgi:G:T/U-mismatch repair DNA glycosylase